MTKLWRAKLRAFSIHLLFSATLIGGFMYVIMFHWFPGQLFYFENVWEGLQILVPVDAILGPLLTLIIFVPGKKGLKGDLAIIITLQLAALAYGGHAIYGSKPEVLAFVGDRFEVITNASYERDKVPADVAALYGKTNPLLIYPLPGQSTEEHNEFVLNNVQYQQMAERYRPLSEYREEVLARALDIQRIKPLMQQEVDLLAEFQKRYDPQDHALFILQGTTKDFIIVSLNMKTFEVQDYLPIDPWDIYDFPDK